MPNKGVAEPIGTDSLAEAELAAPPPESVACRVTGLAATAASATSTVTPMESVKNPAAHARVLVQVRVATVQLQPPSPPILVALSPAGRETVTVVVPFAAAVPTLTGVSNQVPVPGVAPEGGV